MRDDREEFRCNVNQIMVRPLYYGMMVNIMIPMALLLVCYYLNTHGGVANSVGGFADTLFYVVGLLSVGNALFALWWRAKRYARPMVRRRETFENDLKRELLRVSRPIFLLIAAISGYGVIYFFLTGRFRETVFLVFFSFIVFQVVRPRLRQVERLVARQEELVKQGRFLV
jgi:small-conductance mechanosensitive channel